MKDAVGRCQKHHYHDQRLYNQHHHLHHSLSRISHQWSVLVRNPGALKQIFGLDIMATSRANPEADGARNICKGCGYPGAYPSDLKRHLQAFATKYARVKPATLLRENKACREYYRRSHLGYAVARPRRRSRSTAVSFRPRAYTRCGLCPDTWRNIACLRSCGMAS